MATLTKQTITRSGLINATYSSAAGGGDDFIPEKDVFIHVKNGDGTNTEVYVETPKTTVHGTDIADLTVDVPAGQEAFIGPFPADEYADPTNSGLCNLTYEKVTSLTLAVVECPS